MAEKTLHWYASVRSTLRFGMDTIYLGQHPGYQGAELRWSIMLSEARDRFDMNGFFLLDAPPEAPGRRVWIAVSEICFVSFFPRQSGPENAS
jgi:hypothetical protein